MKLGERGAWPARSARWPRRGAREAAESPARPAMRRAGALALSLSAALLAACGGPPEDGRVSAVRAPPGQLADQAARQRHARGSLERGDARQILFGDLHVHTSFSPDGFILGIPLLGGEGVRPPADACDYARHCAAVDFWGISDHAEGLTPRLWSETRQSIRDCNAVGGAGQAPDMVSFLGFEWSHVALTAAQHYGHKNVFFKDTAEGSVPARAIAAPREQFSRAPMGRRAQWAMAALDWANRDFYFGIQSYYDEIAATPICERGVPSDRLPPDCMELARDLRELFAKLDDWGFDALVIPHGNAWGLNTPAATTWDKQLSDSYQHPGYQRLIEIYSGHGNSEEYRDWRHIEPGGEGRASCPAPSEGFLPCCWRAGQLIEQRCEDPGSAECDARVARARQDHVDNGISGHLTVPGASVEDWLNCGQCEDCFNPAFTLRPGASAQYALTLNEAGNAPGRQRFRFGFIGSSDNHRARAGNGFKDIGRRGGNTETMGALEDSGLSRNRHRGDPGRKSSRRVAEMGPIGLNELRNQERQQSFLMTGGLVAAHSAGRDRDAIWEALRERRVYATSGERILLWFDLVTDDGQVHPMGSELSLGAAPRFEVAAAGAFRQRPGCPEHVAEALGEARQASLCANECYNPGDERKRIARIEVVRIRPRQAAAETAAELIEDPWLSLPCGGADGTCRASFGDPDFVRQRRAMIYYARAIQEPTPAVNAGGLRCERDASGACVSVKPCHGDFRTAAHDDCLAPNEERAWSSPIYIDYRG